MANTDLLLMEPMLISDVPSPDGSYGPQPLTHSRPKAPVPAGAFPHFDSLEVCDLRWEHDFRAANLHVRRIGTPSTQSLTGRELRALRAHQRGSEASPFVLCRSAALRSPRLDFHA